MTVKQRLYNSITTWTCNDIHLRNIDIGPQGDVYSGFASIKGDRWKHERIGYAEAPNAKLVDDTSKAIISPTYSDSAAGTKVIYVSSTDGFAQNDWIVIKDKNNSELAQIETIEQQVSVTLMSNLANSYTVNNNMIVYTLPEIHIEKDSGIDVTCDGQWVEISGSNDSSIYEIYDVDITTYTDYDVVRVHILTKDYKTDDVFSMINTNKWKRNSTNPVFNLQRKDWWDYLGQNCRTPEILLNVDIKDDSDGNNISTKHGSFVSSDIENESSQISLLLSKDEDDIYNWSDFLGDKNPGRPNPIIRGSFIWDRFDYVDTADLNKVWQSLDGATVTLASAKMQIAYSGTNTVWGVLPVPFDASIRTNNADTFTCTLTGGGGNTQGNLTVTLIGADGSEYPYIQTNCLITGAAISFDFSTFAGRKYIRAIKFTITSAGAGTITIDDVNPFYPPAWNEIIEDPTVIPGNTKGYFACYYTARERPREVLTANAKLAGKTSLQISVGSTAKFAAGDTVIVYDRTNYELGKVVTVDSVTKMTIEHIGYDEDGSAFEYDYNTANQAMVANNTYKVNQIGASWTGDFTTDNLQDLSQWVKYPTNEASTPILKPGCLTVPAESGTWDEIAVKQPCCRMIGNKVYMAYVGIDASGVNKIGFADSSNFTDFNKYATNPFISPGSCFDSQGCFHPDFKISGNMCIMNYTGYDGSVENIGSATFQNAFHGNNSFYKIVLLVFPVGYDDTKDDYTGFPKDDCVIYDQGNLQIIVNKNNSLSAKCKISGSSDWLITESDTETTKREQSFGTCLAHNHWNLIVCQYEKGEISVSNTKMTPYVVWHDYFTRSPWQMAEDFLPGATTILLKRAYTTAGFIDEVKDFSHVGQDYMLHGYGYTAGDCQTTELHWQVGRIVDVVDNLDDTFTCTLDYPIGEWGFSKNSSNGFTQNQGILLAQGHRKSDAGWSKANQTHMDFDLCCFLDTDDTDNNHILPISYPHTKTCKAGTAGTIEAGYWFKKEDGARIYGYKDDPYFSDKPRWQWVEPVRNNAPLLDPTIAKSPIIGSDQYLGTIATGDQNATQSWNLGYIGHVDISLDILRDTENVSYNTGGKKELFSQMINRQHGSTSDPPDKPQWHKFDLTSDGGLPDPHNLITRWVLTDWDGVKFPGTDANDDPTNLDLYLLGSAGTCTTGYMGRTMYMVRKTGDCAETLFFTDDFIKQNSGDSQFAENLGSADTDRWDSSDVSACHLFKFNDKYRLAYTGKGKVPYPEYGEIIGDLFETSILTTQLCFDAEFDVPADTKVELYVSSTKKTKWGTTPLWRSYPDTGRVLLNAVYPASCYAPEFDYKYNVRWKLKLYSNATVSSYGLCNDLSPIVRTFQVQYEDPGTSPSAQFLAEQDKVDCSRRGIYKVLLWNADTDVLTNITSRIKENGISDLTYNIPVTPDTLGDIYASDVSITVDNTDKIFYQEDAGSYFYNRMYLNDEIIIYSGFVTANALAAGLDGEYEVAGRFKISKISVASNAEAIIECRSIIRAALDTVVGEKIDGEDNPLVFDGKVKDIMETLLTGINVNNCVKATTTGIILGSCIDSENIFIEDFDRSFGNIEINNGTVGSALQSLAQASEGFIYTDHQGNIHFSTFRTVEAGTGLTPYYINRNVSQKNMTFIGQDYDRLAKKAIVEGEGLVQGICTSPTLTIGRDIPIKNEYIQKQEWADSIAANIISRYALDVSEARLTTTSSPSVKIANIVTVAKEFLDITKTPSEANTLTKVKYLTNKITKNITTYQESYELISSFSLK